MIDFNDVRIEKEMTYLFMTNINIKYVHWAFADANITNYRIADLKSVQHDLPKQVAIPTFVPLAIERTDGTGRPCRNPVVLISHMNTVDLTKKLIEVHKLKDVELKHRVNVIRDDATQDYNENQRDYDGKIVVSSESR